MMAYPTANGIATISHYCPRQSGIRCSGQGNSFIWSTSPISLGGGLRGRHDPVQDGSEADGGRQMLQGVVKVAVYGPTDGVSGRQRQAPGLLPLSKRAGTKSCFGQEWVSLYIFRMPGTFPRSSLGE